MVVIKGYNKTIGVVRAEEWRVFQELVADFFRCIPTCKVTVGETLHGARIGSIEVDVVARFGAKKTSAVQGY